ncbi:MAG: dTMP kinase [Planctomycetota bacterium]
MKQGKFIVIDGPDGSGKSTQVKLLADYLKRRGHRVCVVREPGSTVISEQVRRILLDTRNKRMTPETELFLYMASRAQLAAEVISPALRQGRIVIADRFLSSTIAYQGYGGGINRDSIRQMGAIATGGLKPDILIILDIKSDAGLNRIRKGFALCSQSGMARGRHRSSFDRMEKKKLAFHQKVRLGFRALGRLGANSALIDADRPASQVHKEVIDIVAGKLRLR